MTLSTPPHIVFPHPSFHVNHQPTPSPPLAWFLKTFSVRSISSDRKICLGVPRRGFCYFTVPPLFLITPPYAVTMPCGCTPLPSSGGFGPASERMPRFLEQSPPRTEKVLPCPPFCFLPVPVLQGLNNSRLQHPNLPFSIRKNFERESFHLPLKLTFGLEATSSQVLPSSTPPPPSTSLCKPFHAP